MKDYIEKARKQMEARRAAEEEEVRWQRHLQDIAEGKETEKEIIELKKQISELKARLSKYETVD